MARQEQPREDLLAEATALVERCELELDGDSQHIVLGFRAGGAASIYFGEDPAYHFNSRGELRRAYLNGQLLKAEQGHLVTMRRQRSGDQVQLRSRELQSNESSQLLAKLAIRIDSLAAALAGGQYRLVGQVPAEVDVVARGRELLARLQAGIMIAASAGVS